MGGADAYIDIAKEFSDKKRGKGLYDNLSNKTHTRPKCPVILVFDNEYAVSEKPLGKFLSRNDFDNINTDQLDMSKGFMIRVIKNKNLYVVTHPSDGNSEIENLFSDETLNHKINGKMLSLEPNARENGYCEKADFANYVKTITQV